jgi:hypothetical protein
MKNITPENISQVEEYKKYINDLSKVQDKLFTDLENLLELDDDKMNDYVFDYIYNGDESSFEEYLARFGPK